MIAAEIKRARNQEGMIKQLVDDQSLIEKQGNALTELKAKNKSLHEQIKLLQQQLEIVHGELFKLKHHNKLIVIK